MINADPAGLKGVRKKQFMARHVNDIEPGMASAQFAYSVASGAPEVHLKMPDGSEWFVAEDVLEWIVAAVKASREYDEERGKGD